MEFQDFSQTPPKIQGLITFQDCANPVYTKLRVFTGFKFVHKWTTEKKGWDVIKTRNGNEKMKNG